MEDKITKRMADLNLEKKRKIQRDIAADLLDTLARKLLNGVDDIPISWGRYEILLYVEDLVRNEVRANGSLPQRARLVAYHRDTATMTLQGGSKCL